MSTESAFLFATRLYFLFFFVDLILFWEANEKKIKIFFLFGKNLTNIELVSMILIFVNEYLAILIIT